MSKFSVTPESVSDGAGRLGGISDEVLSVHSRLGALSGSAAGTPGDGAFEDLISHWTAVLPHFARSGATLSAALGAAGANYGTTDAGVAAAAS
jgi:hypothetical protein